MFAISNPRIWVSVSTIIFVLSVLVPPMAPITLLAGPMCAERLAAFLASPVSVSGISRVSTLWSVKPALARMFRTYFVSAKANGPGAKGSCGGGDPKRLVAMKRGMVNHGFCVKGPQQAIVRCPIGFRLLRRFVKAAMGFSKNITPKRETR